MENRKEWMDNIRWMTIIIVVIYHVFYYYNNIGIEPMFAGLAPNPAEEGAKVAVTAAALFQYFVYPWFMMLLFVVSGIVANIVLQKKGMKEFLAERFHSVGGRISYFYELSYGRSKGRDTRIRVVSDLLCNGNRCIMVLPGVIFMQSASCFDKNYR